MSANVSTVRPHPFRLHFNRARLREKQASQRSPLGSCVKASGPHSLSSGGQVGHDCHPANMSIVPPGVGGSGGVGVAQSRHTPFT